MREVVSARAATPGDPGGRRRRAAFARASTCIAALSLACTLTQEDFEPREVSALDTVASRGPAPSADPIVATLVGCADAGGCCASASDCPSGQVCANGACVAACFSEDVSACEVPLCPGPACPAARCTDGVQDGREPADCGEGCPALCSDASACLVDGDCASGRCVAARCAAATCSDGVQNQGEAGVDCGGPCEGCERGPCGGEASGSRCGGDPRCPRCGDGAPCQSGADCESGVCDAGVCVSCSDGARNGTETGVDCGGGAPGCAPCADGAACAADADCAGERCVGGLCTSARCDDGIQNGTETGVDCGGSRADCPRCSLGSACASDADCESQRCAGQVCISCADGARNGSESDVDCGGSDPACARCEPGDRCQLDSDCESGACQDGTCCGGTLGDCTRCAERLSPAVDCGAPAEGVDALGVVNCGAFLSCLAENPARCATRNAPGCSGGDPAANACPHNDYGGIAGTGVTRATEVLFDAGCQL